MSPTQPAHIVFAHGNSFPGGTYGVLTRSLQARGFAVQVLDKFGHDPRFPVTDNWPHLVEQLAEFTAAQVRRLGTPAFLVGHSLGGFVSVMLAAQQPELARGVVMLDSPLIGGWRANALGMAKRTQLVGALSPGKVSRARRKQWPDRAAVLEHFRHKRSFAKWDPQVLADYIEHGTRDEQGERVLAFDRDIETRIYNTLPHHLRALLKRHPLRCPVTFIGGRQSQEMKQVGMAMTLAVTQGRTMLLDGSHLFPMEKPLATAAAVEAALRNMQAC